LLSISKWQNRKIADTHVKYLSEIIKRGEWQLNSQGIGIDNFGNLLDGHHRCHAVLDSNIEIPIVVTYGLNSSCFTTYDRGRTRKYSDIAYMKGFSNYSSVGSASIMLYCYDNQLPLSHIDSIKLTNSQIDKVLSNNRGLELSAKIALRSNKILYPSIGTFCHYIFSKIDPNLADNMFEQLIEGLNLQIGNPILTLRNYLINIRMNRIKEKRYVIVNLVIKTWNYIRRNKQIKRLKYFKDDALIRAI
jgi:hypothetical protein